MSTPGFVSYEIEIDKTFERGLLRAQEAVADLRPALKSIAIDFYKYEKTIFQLGSSGKYPDFKGPKISETWKRPGLPSARTRDGSKTAYQYFKKKKYGFEYPLLRATGALESSVTSPSANGSVYNLTEQSVEIGTSIKYAEFHQSDSPRDKIPLRKFLFIPPARLPAWLGILNSYVLRSMGATAEEAKG